MFSMQILFKIIFLIGVVTAHRFPKRGPYPNDLACESKADYTYLNPADSCSCWCLKEKVVCPSCYNPTTNDVILPCSSEPTPVTAENICNGKKDGPINPDDPCSCFCLGGWLACPGCIPPTTTEVVTDTYDKCAGKSDYVFDPDDPCSCMCLDGLEACPDCLMDASTSSKTEAKKRKGVTHRKGYKSHH